MGYFQYLFTEWAGPAKRRPVLLIGAISGAFYLVQNFYTLEFRETLLHWAFLLLAASIIIFSFLLYRQHIRPPSLPPLASDQLTVAITPFLPIGGAAAPDAEKFPHHIKISLEEKVDEGVPLQLKQLPEPIQGATEDERQAAAMALGSSPKGQAHIVIWGDVFLDEEELHIHLRLTVANPLGGKQLEGHEFENRTSTGPDHLDFKKMLASEVADVISLIHGLSYYNDGNFDKAIELLAPLNTFSGLFYLAVVYYSRARQSTSPKADLAAATTALHAVLEMPKEGDLDNNDDTIHNQLGLALMALGEESTGAERIDFLKASIAAFRFSLSVNREIKSPTSWVLVHNNLGNALRTYAEQIEGEGGKLLLDEAIKHYSVALGTSLRDNALEGQAMTYNNMSGALRDLARRSEEEESAGLLDRAVIAIHEALELRNIHDQPLEFAMAMINLASVLSDQAERATEEEKNRLLKEAVSACHSSLVVYTQEDHPRLWAQVNVNLAALLGSLGDNAQDKECIPYYREAIAACRSALEVTTRDGLPFRWARYQSNLGAMLSKLGRRTVGPDKIQLLKEAISTSFAALELFTRDNLPFDWAMAHNNLGTTLLYLGASYDKEEGTILILEAVDAYQSALEVFTKKDYQIYWQQTSRNLEQATEMLRRRKSGG